MLPELVDDPMVLLREDKQRAQALHDPQASFAILATVERDQPAARIVTLRSQQQDRLLVSANATSPKARALRDNPRCELLFYWVTLRRQYRVRGHAVFVQASKQPELYEHVPWRAKTWDHIYESLPQSTAVKARADFVERFRAKLAELQAHHVSAREVPGTPSAGYIAVVPETIDAQELDLEERLHDRRRFERTRDGRWTQTLLVP